MSGAAIRPAERKRRQRQIVDVLAKLPREYRALEHAMAAFGESFDLAAFKQAFGSDDLDAYNRAQAVERGLGRVQNFMTDLAEAGTLLAELPIPEGEHGSRAQRAFAVLRAAGVIDGELCAQLVEGQRARSRIEHVYLDVTAAEVHRAVLLVHGTAQRFVPRFRDWIEPYLPA
jgi:uncharacterized protein YutE (UPF0331/DUF86 family)